MIAVTILGNNSAVPAFDRHPTSQVVTIGGANMLVDCGEGTQIQLINYKIRRRKISHIFISHLHGDHYFGLIGLINTLALLNHQQEINIYGPAPLKEIIELQLKVAETRLSFKLNLYTITCEAMLVDTDDYSVSCFKTTHRIECFGFVFKEKIGRRKLDIEKAESYNIPMSYYPALKKGENYTDESGTTIKNELLTFEQSAPKSYAFCADTRYDENLLKYISGLNMIYHETTYLDVFRERAFERFHSTTKQAATIALKAGVNKLLIGHFSSKYDNVKLAEFENEAKEVFPNTELALEGVVYQVM